MQRGPGPLLNNVDRPRKVLDVPHNPCFVWMLFRKTYCFAYRTINPLRSLRPCLSLRYLPPNQSFTSLRSDDREQTCRALCAISNQPIFWITLLSRNQFLTPLSCPLYEDFSKHDLGHLKSLAWQALRNKKSVRISNDILVEVKEIHHVQVPNGGYILEVLFLVPGTNLVVLKTGCQELNPTYYGDVACWDTSLGEKVCSVQLETDHMFVLRRLGFKSVGSASSP